MLDAGKAGVTRAVDLKRLRIIHYPDPILKRKCALVATFDSGLRRLADRMLELMRAENGVGLAAPQVGVLIRLFVCNPTGNPQDDAVFVNPRFSELGGAAEAKEGCLSIPGVSVAMRRAASATIEAFDLMGNPLSKAGVELEARIWQHETDHLDGRLITDHMSEEDEIANRRAIKQLRADYAARPRS